MQDRAARGRRDRTRTFGTARVAWVVLLLALSVPLAGGQAPRPNFTVSVTASPDRGDAPLEVTLSAYVDTGTPTWFAWSFGDGSAPANGTPAEYQTVTHDYTQSGTFTASVTVSEASGTAKANETIYVDLTPLTTHASATPQTGTVPVTVTFQGVAAGGTGTYTAFNWSFGNGAVGTGATVPWTYTTAGHYHVELNTTDSSGAFAHAFVWVNLTAPTITPPTSTPPGVSVLELVVVAIVGFVIGALMILFLFRRRERAGETLPSTEGTDQSSASSVPTTPAVGEAVEAPAAEPPPAPSAPPPPAPASEVTGPPSPAAAPVPSNEQAAPTTARAPHAPPEALRVSERIVLHLAAQGALRSEEVAPVGFSQGGMAEAIGIRQNALTNVLRRLEAAGILTVDVRHVAGKPRRMKVYRLTNRGESLARDLRRRGGGRLPARDASSDRVADGPDP
jgi:DNA-binding MarR family transcriptional regulator